MKKLITMFLVFVMLFAFSAVVMADDVQTTPVTLNWITARRAFGQNEIYGSFYEIPDFDMDIWVPDFLVPQEDIPADCAYIFTNSDKTASIIAHRVRIEGDTSLDAIEQLVSELGGVSDGFFWINGYKALIYETEADDSVSVVIPFDDGDVIEFVFTPMSNADYYSLFSLVMSTIQPHTLTVEDIALMIDADMLSTWGQNRDVRFTDDENETVISIHMWEDGITSETIGNVTNWDEVRDDRINTYNMYATVLEELGRSDIDLSLLYISPDEDVSFLTISNGEIVYDVAED